MTIRRIALMLAAMSAVLLPGPAPAEAQSLTFKVRSFHKYSVDMKFFSKNRNNIWPGASSHWTLKDSNVHDYKLSCVKGERICYGGATAGSGRMTWGVTLSGKGGCSNCCYTCNGGTTPIINLNER